MQKTSVMKFSQLIFLLLPILAACQNKSQVLAELKTNWQQDVQGGNYTLKDFLSADEELERLTESIYEGLDDTARIAQLLMPAIGRFGDAETTIDFLAKNRMISGLLLLNGTAEECLAWTGKYNAIADSTLNLRFLFSADAEPSLFNRKIANSPKVLKANEIASQEEVQKTAEIISKELKRLGIQYNFAPVVDQAKNATVGYRGFGQNPANIIPWCSTFVAVTQQHNIIATAKHFPGHGLVSGDTHKSLQVIDGDLQELKYYPPLIKNGVMSIMIGHLAVQNNPRYQTDGLPATLSKKIVTDLLKQEMGFRGLIVTDAMNMGGVVNVPQCDVKAIEAGVDIVLMPKDTKTAFDQMYAKFQQNEVFRARAEESIRKVIRMKICLGVI